MMLAIFGAGALAYAALGLSFDQLWPRAGGLTIARDFFSAALTPAVTYQATDLPAGIGPFLIKVLDAVRVTLVFAAAAMTLALLIGLPLGCLASESWWQGRGRAGMAIRWSVRGFVICLRSVHELFWAVLFLAAFGLSPATGVLAIAIPYGGTLAKVFSEMLDEAPRRAADALEGLGASPAQRFLFGLLPSAAPDLAAYAFYRFECSVRAAAVLGFFGIPTLGYYLKLSFENLHYAEVWTYLYAMIALVLLLEAWSSRLRRRFVA
jgi:phosphonate transport system permease protein